MQPEPAHRSSTRASSRLPQPARWPARPAVSVSGRGISTLSADVQGQAVKLPLADEIGHRLPGQTPAAPASRTRSSTSGGGIQRAVPAQLLPALAGGEAHQLPGLQRGGLDPPASAAGHCRISIYRSSYESCLSLLTFDRPVTRRPCPSPPAAPASGPRWPPRSWSRPARWW